MLDGGQDVLPVDMHAEVCILLLGQDLEDPPPRGPALEGGVRQGLAENDVDDLLSQKQLPAPLVLDDAGDGGGGGRPRLGVGALQVPDDGHDLCLAEGSQLGVRGRLDGLGQGVAAAGGAASVPA